MAPVPTSANVRHRRRAEPEEPVYTTKHPASEANVLKLIILMAVGLWMVIGAAVYAWGVA